MKPILFNAEMVRSVMENCGKHALLKCREPIPLMPEEREEAQNHD